MKKEQFKFTACCLEKNAGCQVTTYLRDDHSPLKSCIMEDQNPPANWQQIITNNPPIAPVGGTGESSIKQPALQKQICETCFYFRQLPDNDTCLGVCLRYPPDVNGRHGIITDDTIDYCGEYKVIK